MGDTVIDIRNIIQYLPEFETILQQSIYADWGYRTVKQNVINTSSKFKRLGTGADRKCGFNTAFQKGGIVRLGSHYLRMGRVGTGYNIIIFNNHKYTLSLDKKRIHSRLTQLSGLTIAPPRKTTP